MISNNNGRLKPFIHPATFSGKTVESHTDLQISQDLTWTVDATAKGLQGLHFARYLKRSPPALSPPPQQLLVNFHRPHTASPCGSLAAQSGTGKVPSASLEGQGGSLALRNKGPSQDLLHEERLSHYQTLNTPQTHPTAFTPYYMESVTGLPCTTRLSNSFYHRAVKLLNTQYTHICTYIQAFIHTYSYPSILIANTTYWCICAPSHFPDGSAMHIFYFILYNFEFSYFKTHGIAPTKFMLIKNGWMKMDE